MIFRQSDDDGFGDSSVWRRLTSPFRSVAGSIAELFGHDDSIYVERSLVSRVIGFLTFPFRLLWGFLVFMVQAWPQSRSGFAFLRGVPAILGLMVFFGGLLTADLLFPEAKRIGSTTGYLSYHLANSPEFPEYSLIFAKKLVELNPDNPEYLYQLGLTLDRVGERVKARDVMSSIAFDDRPGFPLAHVWLSEYYVRSAALEMSPEERETQARKHLGFAVEVAPENQSANFELAQLYLAQANRYEKGSDEYNSVLRSAIKCLTTVADGETTGLRLRAVPKLAELEMELGINDPDRRLDNEIIYLQSLARKRPEIFEIWVAIVNCAILRKDYQQAADIVTEGIRLIEEDDSKRNMLELASLIYVEKSDDFTDMSDRNQYAFRLNSLCQAIGLNPTNRIIYLKLLDFIAEKSPPAASSGQNDETKPSDQASGTVLDFSVSDALWLGDSIVGSPVPGVIHALLGMREISKGNVREGEKHWRIAEKQYGRTQLIVNNLIDVAAKERPNEFSNMLDMITLGIELFPDQPVFYQTRGVYLMKQGKTEDALKDLLYASQEMPNMLSLHKYLIECYEKLGQPDRALEQKKLLEESLTLLDADERRRMKASLERLD